MKPERSKFLSPAEFRALLAASRNAPGITTNRNYTLLCLAGNLGLRVQEAVALRVGDLHLKRAPPFVRVATLKRRKKIEHDLPISEQLERVIYARLKRMRAFQGLRARPADPLYGLGCGWFLFPGFEKYPEDPMTSRNAQLIFKRAARVAELDPLFSFHALRHYRGAQIYARTNNLAFVQRALRHASIKSTEIYLHMDPEEEARLNVKAGTII